MLFVSYWDQLENSPNRFLWAVLLVVIRCHSLYHSLSLDVLLACLFINNLKHSYFFRKESSWRMFSNTKEL